MLLANKTAVITGCNRGIGKTILKKFSENGAEVFACARNETDEFTQFIQKLSSETGNAITPIYFDFTNEVALKAAVSTIIGSKKKIDTLVNNAGIATGGLFQMTSLKDLRNVFEVNFFSQVQFTQSISRYMARFKSGSIINIGSTAGIIPNAGTMSYGSSKAAWMFATQTLATELGSANIRVNAIAPGITKTDMYEQMDEVARSRQLDSTALKRPAEASEIANTALFLASDLSTYVTGQILRVDGGLLG